MEARKVKILIVSATARCLFKQCGQNSLCTVVSGHETCEPKPGYRKNPTNAADIVGKCRADRQTDIHPHSNNRIDLIEFSILLV